MRIHSSLLLLMLVAAGCSTPTDGSEIDGVERSLEVSVHSPVRNHSDWDSWLATFDPAVTTSVSDGAVTLVGYVPFDQCRRKLQSDHSVVGGDIIVTLTSTEFPEKPCLTWVAETRYAVTLTGLPPGTYRMLAIENPATRWIDGAPTNRVDTVRVGSVTLP